MPRLAIKPLPEIERLHELFELRCDGCLIHKTESGKGDGFPIGTVVGDKPIKKGAYKGVTVDGVMYRLHRIIFAMANNRHPSPNCYVDHINQDTHDNRPENLREATHSQNLFNTTAHPDNTSGVKGVVWDKYLQRWRARIQVAGKVKYLGVYQDFEEAAFIRQLAAERFFGEFAP